MYNVFFVLCTLLIFLVFFLVLLIHYLNEVLLMRNKV